MCLVNFLLFFTFVSCFLIEAYSRYFLIPLLNAITQAFILLNVNPEPGWLDFYLKKYVYKLTEIFERLIHSWKPLVFGSFPCPQKGKCLNRDVKTAVRSYQNFSEVFQLLSVEYYHLFELLNLTCRAWLYRPRRYCTVGNSWWCLDCNRCALLEGIIFLYFPFKSFVV